MLVRLAAVAAAVVAVVAVVVAAAAAAAAAAEGAGRRADRTCLLLLLSCKASRQQLEAPGEETFWLWVRGHWVGLQANLLQRGRRHAQGGKCCERQWQLFN